MAHPSDFPHRFPPPDDLNWRKLDHNLGRLIAGYTGHIEALQPEIDEDTEEPLFHVPTDNDDVIKRSATGSRRPAPGAVPDGTGNNLGYPFSSICLPL